MRKLILASVLLLGVSSAALARSLIVVLPPDYAGPKDDLAGIIGTTALALKPGDQALVYSARPVGLLATIRRPDGPNATNPAWVKHRLGEQAAPALRYIDELPSTLVNEPPGNLMIPAVVDELARNVLPALPEAGADVLMVGSTLYFDPRDDRWSMMDRFYPSDGELFADPARVPFSVVGKQNRLRGSTFHYCAPEGVEPFVSAEHEAAVHRVQSLQTTEQGGRVGTFSRDLPTCLRRFIAGDASGQPVYQPKRDAKAEMLRAHRPVPAMVPQSMATPGPWFLREDVPISHVPPARTVGVAWIGLKWTADCDVDLYARPNGTSPWLYYGNPPTNDGFLNKDWREATEQGQYEYVEFRQPIDLKTAEVAINLFSGELPTGPEGTVRVWFEGKVYEAPFKVAARSGNGGRPPMAGSAWLRVDLRKVMGIASP